MSSIFQRILHPAWYHGHRKRAPFFEGWYYKLVDATELHRWAIIPGIFKSDDPGRHHAFIQVLDGLTGQVFYHRVPVERFWAAQDRLEVRVGDSLFTADSLVLDIQSPGQTLHGEVRLRGLTPWPVTLAAPGIMGWYSWVPFMECYHGVLSLDHALEGTFATDGETIDWNGGRGYVEKDWGVSFPAAWIWFQTNHFSHPGTSLTASVAIIPWLRSAFRGHIIGLWHEGTLYRFATYTGAKIDRLTATDKQVSLVLHDHKHRLEMCATRGESGLLLGPSRMDMGVRVPETLGATVDVRLSTWGNGEQALLLEDTGRHAGLEIAGEWERLLSP